MGRPLYEAALEHLAMQYALASLDVDPDKAEGLFDLKPTIEHSEWMLGSLRTHMEHRFGCFQTQEAIKQALEVVRMVIPDQGPT